MKLLNVPQGYYAIYDNSDFDIEGLYTDNFSTCNIFICIAENGKRLLAHIDDPMSQQLEQLIQAIKAMGDCKIILIHRKEYGAPILRVISDKLKEKFLDFTSLEISRLEIIGIIADNDGIGQVLNARPDNVLYHPLEQQAEAVEKIESLICPEAGKQVKNRCIFDGLSWKTFNPEEFRVLPKNPGVAEIFTRFNPKQTITEMTTIFAQLINAISPYIMAARRNLLIDTFLPYIDAYFNGFNLRKEEIPKEFEESYGYYRQCYDAYQISKEYKGKISALLKDAIALNEQKKHEEAAPLFREVLTLATWIYSRDEASLAAAFYNLARTLYKIAKKNTDPEFLKEAKKYFNLLKKINPGHGKLEDALAKCEQLNRKITDSKSVSFSR